MLLLVFAMYHSPTPALRHSVDYMKTDMKFTELEVRHPGNAVFSRLMRFLLHRVCYPCTCSCMPEVFMQGCPSLAGVFCPGFCSIDSASASLHPHCDLLWHSTKCHPQFDSHKMCQPAWHESNGNSVPGCCCCALFAVRPWPGQRHPHCVPVALQELADEGRGHDSKPYRGPKAASAAQDLCVGRCGRAECSTTCARHQRLQLT
jgi:hypothetical protein